MIPNLAPSAGWSNMSTDEGALLVSPERNGRCLSRVLLLAVQSGMDMLDGINYGGEDIPLSQTLLIFYVWLLQTKW